MIVRQFIYAFVLLAMAVSGSRATDVTEEYKNAACSRLDVESLNTPPIYWVSEDILSYIEAFVENHCENEIRSVTSTERLVDLAYLDELLNLVPSSTIMVTQDKGTFRIEVARARLQKDMIKTPRLPKRSLEYNFHDFAVTKFLGCQISHYARLEICDIRNFNFMKTASENMSSDQKADVVFGLLEIKEKKKRLWSELDLDPN